MEDFLAGRQEEVPASTGRTTPNITSCPMLATTKTMFALIFCPCHNDKIVGTLKYIRVVLEGGNAYETEEHLVHGHPIRYHATRNL